MKTQWAIFILALITASSTFAQDLSIVDVRRNITLADDDIVYKDFYLNGGESDGLKKNLVVTAFRKIQVRDSNGNQSFGEISVPVGQLRVIATYSKVSVAREYKLLSRDELPMLEQTGLMSGDRIELKGSFLDDKKPTYKKKTTASTLALPQETAVVIATPTITAMAAPVTSATAPPAPKAAVVTPVNSAKTADANPAKAQ